MDRTELERLDRDALIRRAEELGVTRPRILTRPELIDELLLRSAGGSPGGAGRARGFFGLARDLLLRVVERGLHLPDAASRLRSIVPEGGIRATTILPTVTLAEIYAAQGHTARALETVERVLEREPDHAAARSLRARLTDPKYASPEPPLPPEEEEPRGRVSAPEREPDETRETEAQEPGAHEPEVEAAPAEKVMVGDPGEHGLVIAREEGCARVSWSVRATRWERKMSPETSGEAILRVHVIVPTWDGPRTESRDVVVRDRRGELVVPDVPAKSVVCAAVGLRAGDAFSPMAHGLLLEKSGPRPPEAKRSRPRLDVYTMSNG